MRPSTDRSYGQFPLLVFLCLLLVMLSVSPRALAQCVPGQPLVHEGLHRAGPAVNDIWA